MLRNSCHKSFIRKYIFNFLSVIGEATEVSNCHFDDLIRKHELQTIFFLSVLFVQIQFLLIDRDKSS